MCGGVNDSNGENISNDKTYFPLLLILLSLLLLIFALGEHGLSFSFLSFFQVGSKYL